MRQAKDLARRYRLPFVNLLPQDGESPIDYSACLSEIPVDLMLRNQFVPLRRENGKLHVAMADPTNLDRLDELAGALRTRMVPYVATAGAIDVVLRKGDATQRVLQEAASGFRISLVGRPSRAKKFSISIGWRPTAICRRSSSWSTRSFTTRWNRAPPTFTSKRATRDVQVKYRIDGALYEKVDPIDLAYHQTLISRIKVMSELDIAERRVPQDGRFRVRYKGRTVDFRVSIMPTVHGEDAVIRILDKEQINEEFKNLNLDVVGFRSGRLAKVSALHQRAVRHGAGDRADRFG